MICKKCGKELKRLSKGYCNSCYFNLPEIHDKLVEKTKQTNLERYGVSSTFQIPSAKLSLKNKIKDKYGVNNIFEVEDIKNKILDIKLLRYGENWRRIHVVPSDRNSFKREDVKQKIRETTFKRLGVYNSLQSDEVREKIKKTNLERYGVENAAQSEKIKDKIKETNIERYGRSYGLNLDKARETCKQKYGVDYNCQTSQCRRSYNTISKINKRWQELLNIQDADLEFPLGAKSFDFKRESTLIEINPSIFHNSTFSPFNKPLDKNYHLEKTKLANDNGFECVHI